MSNEKLPLSRRHLDIAIERLASRFGEAQRIRRAVANTIVAQLMPDCVIKGGSSLKFRYGDIATRVTKDMDAAQGADLDAFIAKLDKALHGGWNGFTGHVVRRLSWANYGMLDMPQPSTTYLSRRRSPKRLTGQTN